MPLARFHVATGPSSLFERVRLKFNTAKRLQLHAEHLAMRAEERHIPVSALQQFDPVSWKLVMAEVRVDTGKFVNATWEVTIDGRTYWIVIGFGDTVLTVIDIREGRSGAFSERIVRSGELYDFVNTINTGLMRKANT